MWLHNGNIWKVLPEALVPFIEERKRSEGGIYSNCINRHSTTTWPLSVVTDAIRCIECNITKLVSLHNGTKEILLANSLSQRQIGFSSTSFNFPWITSIRQREYFYVSLFNLLYHCSDLVRITLWRNNLPLLRVDRGRSAKGKWVFNEH